jgi:4-hydroxy 2-oxovalerate aldolase
MTRFSSRKSVKNAKIAALLLPGIGTRNDLRAAVEAGIQKVRIATLCTEADVSEQHFGLAKELGLETVGFLMMSHPRPPEVLVQQALLMEKYGADWVYIVDSAGAMLPSDAYSRVKALSEALTTAQPGFHAHNNLGVAIGNTLAALDAGATIVDGTLRGYGAGAGNTATEVLAAVLERIGLNPGLDVFKLMDAAEFILAPIQTFQPYPDRDSVAIGYAGVYSTFLLYAKRIGGELGVDPRDILMELGRRQTVAGQEDWIMRVGLELQAAQKVSV